MNLLSGFNQSSRYIIVSITCFILFYLFYFIYFILFITENSGPKIDPCATPAIISVISDS